MMKVCIFCHDLKMSGANLALLEWLKDAKYSDNSYVVVLPRYNRKTKEAFENIGIEVIVGFYKPVYKNQYKMSLLKTIKTFFLILYAIIFNNISYFYIFLKLKNMNIDIIHSNSFATVAGVKVAILLKKQHIWHIREFMEEDHQIKHYFENKIRRYCEYSNAIFISDVIKEKYIKKYNFKKNIVIYDKVEYDSKYKKNRKFLEDGCCNIILVGTISENKGQIDAIKAIQHLNTMKINSRLFICGTGPNEQELKKYVERNSIDNVNFLGYVNNVMSLREKMDIALMCSTKEALGRVTIEAQYYENLIIGANCGCTPYIIDNDKTGLLYDKEKNDLAEKIMYCVTHKEIYNNIVKQAKKQSLKKYSEGILKKIEKYYIDCLKNNTC